MIGYLSGEVVGVLPTGAAIIDVSGVGYEVLVASATQVGERRSWFVHTAVRADAIVLFGFDSLDEREFFTTLLGAPGVGPSTAMAALRTLGEGRLRSAIASGDSTAVATVPGIGPKTAQRIVMELKDKVGPSDASPSQRQDIVDALKSLGYQASEIRNALEGVTLPDDEAEALRAALAALGRR